MSRPRVDLAATPPGTLVLKGQHAHASRWPQTMMDPGGGLIEAVWPRLSGPVSALFWGGTPLRCRGRPTTARLRARNRGLRRAPLG